MDEKSRCNECICNKCPINDVCRCYECDGDVPIKKEDCDTLEHN